MSAEPAPLTRRLAACVEQWPECWEGEYNPACCRFPKSCSCTVYDPRRVTGSDLEPERTPPPPPTPLAEPAPLSEEQVDTLGDWLSRVGFGRGGYSYRVWAKELLRSDWLVRMLADATERGKAEGRKEAARAVEQLQRYDITLEGHDVLYKEDAVAAARGGDR